MNAQGPKPPLPEQKHVLPWLVGLAFLVAFVLAILWMSKEVARTRQIRNNNLDPLAAPTNGAAAVPK